MKELQSFNYTIDEVRAILNSYLDLLDCRDIEWVHTRLMDFESAFSKLPEKQRKALYHIDILGLDVDVASTMFGINVNTMNTRRKRGINKLLEMMNGKQQGD